MIRLTVEYFNDDDGNNAESIHSCDISNPHLIAIFDEMWPSFVRNEYRKLTDRMEYNTLVEVSEH